MCMLGWQHKPALQHIIKRVLCNTQMAGGCRVGICIRCHLHLIRMNAINLYQPQMSWMQSYWNECMSSALYLHYFGIMGEVEWRRWEKWIHFLKPIIIIQHFNIPLISFRIGILYYQIPINQLISFKNAN